MPDGSGAMAKFQVDNNVPAWKNENFLKGFAHMILVSRKTSQWNNDHELAMWQEALKRNNVTPVEAYNAFWAAFSDPYTPASGIEWKNLWKHIQKNRENSYDAKDVNWDEIEKTRKKYDVNQ